MSTKVVVQINLTLSFALPWDSAASAYLCKALCHWIRLLSTAAVGFGVHEKYFLSIIFIFIEIIRMGELRILRCINLQMVNCEERQKKLGKRWNALLE